MSQLRIKLAKKLSLFFNDEIKPEDIEFSRGGNRTDVVRWSIYGYECYLSASNSVKENVNFEIAELPQPYGIFEIYAIEI